MAAPKINSLKRRIERFLSSSKYGRQEVSALIQELSRTGDVVIFGGMIRELTFEGNKNFASDVDLILRNTSLTPLELLLKNHRFERNKFGGFRIKLTRWMVDLWRFEDTWAFKEGLVEPNSLESLLETTFFNWDAVIYSVPNHILLTKENYLSATRRRFLDINLESSPNPVGNAVKALRYCKQHRANFSPRLANFVHETLSNQAPNWIASYESRAHGYPVLTEPFITRVMSELNFHVRETPLLPFELEKSQPRLM